MPLRSTSRRWIRRIHLILSLTVGLLFAVIAVSGSILTFRHEIDRWLHPPPAWDGEDMGFAAAREQALAARPDMQIQILWFPNEVRPFYEAAYFDGEDEFTAYYRFHPADGRELPQPDETFMQWMTTFHVNLQLGEFGLWVVQHVTLLALGLVVTGVVLWWPGWKPRLWFKLRRRGGLLTYDLHRVLGLAATPVLLLCIVTGLAWAFPNAARTVVWGATGRRVPAEESKLAWERPSTPPEGKPVTEASDEQLLADAKKRAPEDAFIFYITYPIRPDENRQVRMQLGYDPYPYGEVYRYYYDRYHGELLGAVDPRLTRAPDAFLDTWTSPLHYGTWGGAVTQFLYLFATLVPVLLAVTGWILWRRHARRVRAAAACRLGGARGVQQTQDTTDKPRTALAEHFP